MKKVSLLIMLVAFFASVSFAQVSPVNPKENNNQQATGKVVNNKNNNAAVKPTNTNVATQQATSKQVAAKEIANNNLVLTIENLKAQDENAINNILNNIEGVSNVQINKANNTVTIKLDRKLATPEKVIQKLNSAKYQASVVKEIQKDNGQR